MAEQPDEKLIYAEGYTASGLYIRLPVAVETEEETQENEQD